MSKIINITECGPTCPFFRPYGSLAPQHAQDGIACYYEHGNSHNFWIKRLSSNGFISTLSVDMNNSFPRGCDFIEKVFNMKKVQVACQGL